MALRALIQKSLLFVSASCVFLSSILQAEQPGALSGDFPAVFSGGVVNRLAVRPDGKVLVTGGFTSVDGYPANGIALLNPDGTIVPSFKLKLTRVGNWYGCLVAYPDGRMLVGGDFYGTGGARVGLARLNPDGSIDPSFLPELGTQMVTAVSLQKDGKILVCGDSFCRLNSDGSKDVTFVPPAFYYGNATAAIELADGKILIVGSVAVISPLGSREGLIRLFPDGEVDFSFNIGLGNSARGGQAIEQMDGKIILVGSREMKRILADGATDPTFSFNFPDAYVNQVALQSDGKMILACEFPEVGGKKPNAIMRINADGSPDTSFVTPTGFAHALAATPDRGFVAAGYLSWDGGTESNRLTKIFHDSAPARLESPDNTSVRWTVGGAFPEHHQVAFDILPQGQAAWVRLGEGHRTVDGWALGGLSLPPNGILRVRARGVVSHRASTAIEGFKNLGSILPAATLFGPAGESLASGSGAIDFGNVLSGKSRILRLGIRNDGDAALADVLPVISGSSVSAFSIVSKPGLPILPGQTDYLEIKFNPLSAGAAQATLSVSSNDPAAPHSLSLAGAGGSVFDPTFYGAGDTIVTNGSFNATGLTFGQLRLEFAPLPGTKLLAVNNLGSAAIIGRFADLADGATVSATKDGITYTFLAGYAAGDGNDLVLTLLGPGVLDPSYIPTFSNQKTVMALPETLEETVIGGAFSSVNGQNRKFLAKLTGGQPNLATFDSKLDGGSAVETIIRLATGDMLVAGGFTSANGIPAFRISRFKPDGSLDPGFIAKADSTVTAAAIQSDGKILIAGYFDFVNSISRPCVARLNPDGSLDASFTGVPAYGIKSLVLQADGKILIGGGFLVSGVGKGLLRLMPDGSRDTSFNAILGSGSGEEINSILVEPSGHIVIGGWFQKVNSVDIKHMARLTPSGELDTSFRPEPNMSVYAIQRQVDGNLLIGGDFFEVGGISRNRLARISAQGVVDPSFAPEFSGGAVMNLSLRPDGAILAGGEFTMVNGVPRRGLVKILNHPISSSLDIVGNSTVRWMRGGTLPLEQSVDFEIREDGVLEWRSLGHARGIPGGWELDQVPLPSNGLIRARSSILAGDVSYRQVVELGGFGAVRSLLEVSDSSSGRQLERPTAEVDFGSILIPLSSTRDLKLLNSGTAGLEDIVPTISGPAASDFSVTVVPPASLSPTDFATLQVTFSPGASGARTAELRVASNDPDGDFVILLTGQAGNTFSPLFDGPGDIPIAVESLDLAGKIFAGIELGFAPTPGTILTAIQVMGSNAISGTLSGLSDQSFVTATFEGKEYVFLANYRGGDGNDLTFTLNGPAVAEATFAPSPDGMPAAVAVQEDGKILISGFFTAVGGNNIGNLARLLPNGTLDTTFPVTGSKAESIAIQNDGKILVAGDVTGAGGVQRLKLARLNADGTLDESFQANITGTVFRVCLLRNGKILIGGNFTKVDNVSKVGVARLNSNGTLDSAFTANISGGGQNIYALAEQPDGKLLLGGWYTSINGTARTYLARVGVDGAVDMPFNPKMTSQAGGTSSIAIQPDGKILVGGFISSMAGAARNNIVRLNADGTLDPYFFADADQPSTCIRLQADGKIMVSGLFTIMNGVKRPALARLHSDGSLDHSFNPNPERNNGSAPSVYTMVMPPDGGLLIGGTFDHVDNRGGANFAKLGKDEMLSEIVPIGGSKIRWNTGGALTQMHSTSFEVSTNNGASWTSLGAGVRTQSGWSIEGISLPPSGLIRAFGTQILTSRATSARTSEVLQFTRRDLTALEAWRDEHFGEPFDGTGDMQDSDQDGLKNILEFAFGLNPRLASSRSVPEWSRSGDHYEAAFNQPEGVEGVIYGAEWSETMAENDWHPAEDVSLGTLKRFRVPVSSRTTLFFRLKVTAP